MKRLLTTLLVLLPMMVMAQVQFGYLSYNEVLKQMPEYLTGQQQLIELKAKYDAEATRGEEEFQRKFSEFLQGQKEFPQNILVKRQAELQDLMDKAVKFREECQTLLAQAEQDMLRDLTKKLDDAIQEVGMTSGLAAILNTDDHKAPFVNPALSVDVTPLVLNTLGIKVELPPVETPAAEVPQQEVPAP